MKLKPSIKTHWLASQNPLTVSLAGLQRVVFAPRMSLLNSQFSPESKVIEIPGEDEVYSITPDVEEIQAMKYRQFQASMDLFSSLFTGHDFLSQRMSPQLKTLAQSLEFHFDDGQCLSLVGLFRRPGLPLFVNPKFYLQDRSCLWEQVLEKKSADLLKPLKLSETQKRNLDFKKTWIVILEIIAWSLQRQRQVGDLQVLWVEPQQVSDKNIKASTRQAFELNDLEFLSSRPLAATVMAEGVQQNTARIILWEGEAKHPAHGSLHLHSVPFFYEHALPGHFQDHDIVTQPEELKAISTLDTDYNWCPRQFGLQSSSREILKTYERIESWISKENIFFVNHFVIQGKQFKPKLSTREYDGSLQISVSFLLAQLAVKHANMPRYIEKVLAPFFGGFDLYFGLDRKDFASRNDQHRAADMLFLRHQGLALFCLLELINWILQKPLSSGAEIEFIEDQTLPEADRQFEKFIQYLKESIPGLLGKPGAPFEQMFSGPVKGLLYDFTEKIFLALRQDQFLIFRDQKVVEIKNIHNQVLPILRFLLLYLIESNQGKILTRVQSPMGEKFLHDIRLWTESQVIADAAWSADDMLWLDVGLPHKCMVPLLFEMADAGFDIEFNGKPFIAEDSPFEFVFSVTDSEKENANWFDLHPQIFFNGTRVVTEEVHLNFIPGQVGFVEYRGQMYRIDKKQVPTLKSLQKFWSKIKGQKLGLQRDAFGEKVFRLQKSQALELLMLKAQGLQIEVTGQWKKVFDYFENGLGVDKIQLPEEMNQVLLRHQREGAQWLHDLYELKLGAILADEMGLGKTFQVLAFLASLQMQKKLGKCLVIVPTSLVYNWLDEKKKFAPNLPVRVFQSQDLDKIKTEMAETEDLVLIATYGLLTENPSFFEAYNWNVLAFDEAQNLKNITSLRSVTARKLKAQFKVCLTGTPMENNYLEFFSLCDLVVPGSLGEVKAFRNMYYNRDVSVESLRELRLISKPLLLRRTKAQVKLSLPEKTIQKVLLPFSEKQKEIYKKMAMAFSRQVEDLILEQGERKAQIAMFAALMRLRQICSDPAAVPGVQYPEKPVKIEHFLSSLQEHLENNESVIVFTQFLSTLNRIESELKKAQVPTFTLQGKVSAKERLRLIGEFQNQTEPAVMLMTLKTGGVGLNLTKASVVYHLEPWWNPAVENQATDRAHRMGQTKDVKVYNLLIEGSLEERIADLKLKKQDSFDLLFGVDEMLEDANISSDYALTRDDFIYLLK